VHVNKTRQRQRIPRDRPITLHVSVQRRPVLLRRRGRRGFQWDCPRLYQCTPIIITTIAAGSKGRDSDAPSITITIISALVQPW
jgi:hypothetical protein